MISPPGGPRSRFEAFDEQDAASKSELAEHLRANHVQVAAQYWQQLVRALAPDAAVRLLDAGCGAGYSLQALRGGFPSLGLCGIDKSKELTAVSAARLAASVFVSVQDAEQLAFADASFDRVLAERLFSHLSDGKAEAVLAEIKRVMAPAGRFVMVDPNVAALRFEHPAPEFTAELLEAYLSCFQNPCLAGPRAAALLVHSGFCGVQSTAVEVRHGKEGASRIFGHMRSSCQRGLLRLGGHGSAERTRDLLETWLAHFAAGPPDALIASSTYYITSGWAAGGA